MSKYSSAYYFANREKIIVQKRAAGARYRKKHPGNRAKPGYIRQWRLKKIYGLTVSQYDRLLDQQNGLCAVCEKDIRGKAINGDVKAHIDHCHRTGAVRGLLCMICNTRIGVLETWPYRAKAEAYLLKTKG